jgi:hypothetical protein
MPPKSRAAKACPVDTIINSIDAQLFSFKTAARQRARSTAGS